LSIEFIFEKQQTKVFEKKTKKKQCVIKKKKEFAVMMVIYIFFFQSGWSPTLYFDIFIFFICLFYLFFTKISNFYWATLFNNKSEL